MVFTASDGSPVDPTNFMEDVWRPTPATLVEPGQVVKTPPLPGRANRANARRSSGTPYAAWDGSTGSRSRP